MTMTGAASSFARVSAACRYRHRRQSSCRSSTRRTRFQELKVNAMKTASGLPTAKAEIRRHILKGGLLASLMALLPKQAAAIPPNDTEARTSSTGKDARKTPQAYGQPSDAPGLLDAFAVSQVLLRERLARELHDYNGEEACFYPDADVEVSWFKGTAAEFVEAGRKTRAAGDNDDSAYFDSLGPASVSVHKDRAISDSACAIHTFLPLDGVQASMTSFTHLLCRVRKSQAEWRIAGLRAIYIRDRLEPCNPAQIPKIDLAKLARYRASHRHLSYALQANGRPLRDDLPGVDQPELVAALRAADRLWLHEA